MARFNHYLEAGGGNGQEEHEYWCSSGHKCADENFVISRSEQNVRQQISLVATCRFKTFAFHSNFKMSFLVVSHRNKTHWTDREECEAVNFKVQFWHKLIPWKKTKQWSKSTVPQFDNLDVLFSQKKPLVNVEIRNLLFGLTCVCILTWLWNT